MSELGLRAKPARYDDGVRDRRNVALLPVEPIGDEWDVALESARGRRRPSNDGHVPTINRVAPADVADVVGTHGRGEASWRWRPRHCNGGLGIQHVFITGPLHVVRRVTDIPGHRPIADSDGGGRSGRADCGAAAAAATCRAHTAADEPGHVDTLDATGALDGLSLTRTPHSPTVPGCNPNAALRHKPPPQVPFDSVVERAEPAGVALDERPDRFSVGRHRCFGLCRVDAIQRAIDRARVGAVGIDPVAESRGLRGRQDDVDFDLVRLCEREATGNNGVSRAGDRDGRRNAQPASRLLEKGGGRRSRRGLAKGGQEPTF